MGNSSSSRKLIGANLIQYGLWAHFMGYGAVFMCLWLGLFAILWEHPTSYGCKVGGEFINSLYLFNASGICANTFIPNTTLGREVLEGNKYIGALYMAYGALLFAIECYPWYPNDSISYRFRISFCSVLNALVGVVGLGTYVTALAGTCLLILAAVQAYACFHQECGDGGHVQAAAAGAKDLTTAVAKPQTLVMDSSSPSLSTIPLSPESAVSVAAAGGFSFGNAPAAPDESAPVSPGFSFRNAPFSTGFIFGNAPAAPAVPAPGSGGFSFGNAPAPAAYGSIFRPPSPELFVRNPSMSAKEDLLPTLPAASAPSPSGDAKSSKQSSIPPAAAAAGPDLSLSLAPERREVALTAQSDFHVNINLKACEVKLQTRAERVPMDLVCVLDNSGSMGGTKIQCLKEAVRFVSSQLGPGDRLSIVLFNSHASVVHGLLRMTEANKGLSGASVDSIYATGGTDIYDGLRTAASILDDRKTMNPLSCIFLLTDGQDGSRMREKMDLARGLRAKGQSLFVFGFGNDHDSAQLQQLADASEGQFTFVEKDDVVVDAFGGAIGGQQGVLARDIQLTVFIPPECAPGLRLSATHAGRYAVAPAEDGRSAVVQFANMYLGEQRDVLVEMSMPACDGPQDLYPLLAAHASYAVPDAGADAARRGYAEPIRVVASVSVSASSSSAPPLPPLLSPTRPALVSTPKKSITPEPAPSTTMVTRSQTKTKSKTNGGQLGEVGFAEEHKSGVAGGGCVPSSAIASCCVKRCSDPVGDVDVDVDTQKNRARTTAALETALTQADAGNFLEARTGLQTTIDAIKASPSMAAGRITCASMVEDLEEGLRKVQNTSEYNVSGGKAAMLESMQCNRAQRMVYSKAGKGSNAYQSRSSVQAQSDASNFKMSKKSFF